MTQEKFNEIWKDHIEDRFWGLEIISEKVADYLHKEFTEYVKDNPDFEFSQIKPKWNYVCAYTNASSEQNHKWEIGILNVLAKEREEIEKFNTTQTT